MEQENPGSAVKAKQGRDAASGETRALWWAEASIWTDRMVSALGNGVKACPWAGQGPDPRGGKWFSLIDKVIRPSTLEAAWQRVARNKGAAGVDGQSVERFAYQSARYLLELHAELKAGTYRPSPVKRVEIPKGDGKTRPLGIPTVKDRIVQAALKMVIEPIFEVQFREGSHGFRPGRGCKDALRAVDRLLKEGNTFVVDADLKGYFDSIPHDRLMALVEGSISDGRVLSLIESFLHQDIMTDTARWHNEGAPVDGTFGESFFSHGGRAEDHGAHGVGGAPRPWGPSDSVFTVVLRASSVRKCGESRSTGDGFSRSVARGFRGFPNAIRYRTYENAVLRRRSKMSESAPSP
jgi:RNA-directed DNA polymerase